MVSFRLVSWQPLRTNWTGCFESNKKEPNKTKQEEADGSNLWMALMCICSPFRLDPRWPHSSHTNGFSPRCFDASCTCSSVRVRKVLGHCGHWNQSWSSDRAAAVQFGSVVLMQRNKEPDYFMSHSSSAFFVSPAAERQVTLPLCVGWIQHWQHYNSVLHKQS